MQDQEFQVLGEYEQRIMLQSGKFEADYNGQFGERDLQIKKCQFCGHRISVGYRLKNLKDNTLLIVGSDCFSNLLHLDKEKIRLLKYAESLLKHQVKYANVISFLKEHHKSISEIEWCLGYRFENYSNVRYEILPDNKIRWISDDGMYGRLGLTEHYTPESIHLTEGIGVDTAMKIIQKICFTTKINPYWFQEYKKITGIDLMEINKNGR